MIRPPAARLRRVRFKDVATKGGFVKSRATGMTLLAGAAAMALLASHSGAQTAAPADPNGAPNPCQLEAGWLKMPEGRKMGQAISVDVDRDGTPRRPTRPAPIGWPIFHAKTWA
jgi:hypothetical protein